MNLWPFKPRWKRDWRRIAKRLRQVAKEQGVMEHPRIDWGANQLVDGALRIDMLNVYHYSQQLEHPETEKILRCWIAPEHLGHACCYGRVDAVRRLLAAGASPDGDDFGGSPIDAAMEAWVTTPLHVECVRALLDAGARLSPGSFCLSPESVGSDVDFDIVDVLVEYGVRHSDSSVRMAAEGANVDGARDSFRLVRAAGAN